MKQKLLVFFAYIFALMPLLAQEVGHTPGELSVSATGAATYTVPIAVPPGINGVEPDIALTYNSQGGNGLAGWGWNISGISVITRVPSTKFHDGQVAGVDFTATDRFALDGQRLLLKSGTYGKDGAVYETENYSNMKITSHGTSPYGATYGPAHFKVTYPDGSFAIYGNGSNSRSRTDFAITYWENPQGIRVSYSYVAANNGISIKTIKYGSKGAATPINEIEFIYTDRDRAEQAYIGGVSFVRTNILNEIKVKGNGVGYRNYILSYTPVSPGYQCIAGIQEKSGDGSKSFEPIKFNYRSSGNYIDPQDVPGTLSIGNVGQHNAQNVTGDFTGNGKMDFILYPTSGTDRKKKFWLFTDIQDQGGSLNFGATYNTGAFEDIFAVNYLDNFNRAPSRQGLAVVQKDGQSRVRFRIYGAGIPSTGAYLGLHYTKTWSIPTYQTVLYCDNNCQEISGQNPVPVDYYSGDFNGDGLTDVIAVERTYSIGHFCDEDDPQWGECTLVSNQIVSKKVHFLNLDRRLSDTEFASEAGTLQISGSIGNILTADVTGDGKTNILHVTSGKLFVYGLDNSNKLKLLWETSDTRIKTGFPVLLGDYNGDGKTDFIIPKAKDSKEFGLFMSTGKGYVASDRTYPFEYKETNFGSSGNALFGYTLIPIDINGDGRTDIVDYRTITYNNDYVGVQNVIAYTNTPSSVPTRPEFTHWKTGTKRGDVKNFPIPIFLPSDKPNVNLDFASISDNRVSIFSFLNDVREEVKLRSVVNNNITEVITYSALDPAAFSDVEPYSSVNEEVYPYIDIEASQGIHVVSKLEQSGFGVPTIQQLFSYHGAVSHAKGLGFLGFKRLSRSNWHMSYNDRKFNTTYHSPQLRGAVTKEFTTRGAPVSTALGAKDPSPSHITLSSASTGTRTATQSVTLKPGFSANSSNGTFTARTDQDTGINDGASSTVSHYITRTDYKYSTETRANKVFVNVPVEVATKDLLNGTHTFKTYTYDSYKNPTREYTNISGKGTHTVTMKYENKNGAGGTYYIGRPTNKVETRTAYGNTYTTEEGYDYTGDFLTEIKTKGHGTDFMIEAREYDSYGNVIKKTITPPGGGVPRVTEYKYGNTYGGRFLTETTDVAGMVSAYKYYPVTGNLEEETNPYGQVTKYEYDAWGRVTKVTDYRGKSLTTTYTKSGQNSRITETGDDGSSKESNYNILGHLVAIREKNVVGQWVYKRIKYDHIGRQIEESEPAIGGVSQWNTTEYDIYGRVSKTTSYTGKTTTITYNGLTTTANDGTKTVITTRDALGNVTKITDPGGTINYTYYANNSLKTADYSGSVQRMEQDGWGRKTKLVDPSAGTYTYEYNGFGETVKETTPKGTTTYTYKPDGRLESKKIDGEHTDMQWAYVYNESTKLPTTTTLTNADGNNTTYTLTYDATHPQLVRKVVETNPYAVFTRNYTYDSFNRVATEEFIARNIANSKTGTKRIRNTYQNGALKSISDFSSQEVLWEVNNLNGWGQVTEADLGENIRQVNTYDSYGFPTQLKTQKVTTSGAAVDRITLGYEFNIQRGTLTSRSNSMFSWNETFEYDNLDRLTHFNDNNSNNSQSYDSRGRITKNSALGNYAYSGVSYQNTKITVDEEALIPGSTEAARQYYQDHPQQSISYNAFKSPVEIREHGKERISFQYNAALGRSHIYYGGEESDKMQRRYRKHYSADGSMEIKEDTETGKTTFVTYIGGDAYSAPLIWHSEQATTTTNNYYYLHRDYLGSILAITDQEGNFKERRHFDAWGNIVKLTNGSGTALNNFTILDRGYTGHEHLVGVGLVHMNGRLYDPVMHRFLMPDNYVQDPYNTQNFNRYGYVLNNPLMYTDPSGELAWFIPVIIGAVIGGTSAAIAGGNFGQILGGTLIGAVSGFVGGGIGSLASGGGFIGTGVATTMSLGGAALGGAAGGFIGGAGTAWLNGANFGQGLGAGLRGGLVGGVGGMFGMIGGGSFAANTAYGIAGGGITGGLAALLSGGDVGQGMLYGGIAGGAFAAVTSLPEAIKNWKDGYGFGTNAGRFNKMVRNAVLGGTADPVRAQAALDFWTNRYGGPQLNYSATGSPSTSVTGRITISGQKFIDGVGHVRRAIAHEMGHYVHNLNWDNGEVGGTISNPTFINLDRSMYNGDGIYGYNSAIMNAGRYHIGYSAISNGLTAPLVAPAWQNYGISKWFQLIPRRFF